MSDIVNLFFKRFYPPVLDKTKFEFTAMLGGMQRYRDSTIENVFPRMECKDGFHFSVQAHAGAYCKPRDDFADNYSKVEVGFPSRTEPLLMPYVEDADRPTDTVYGYVPINVVIAVIEKHGGLKGAYIYPENEPEPRSK